MNALTITLLMFVTLCFAGGNAGGGSAGGGSAGGGAPAPVVSDPYEGLPARPEPDVTCEIKGNDQRGSQHNEDKVWICHGTASETNPYVLINVDDASTVRGHFHSSAPGHGKKNHPDIWPNSVGYDGLKYDCNCERIVPPSPPPPPSDSPAPPPPPEAEVFTVALSVDVHDVCPELSINRDGACEDSLIPVRIQKTFNVAETDVTSCFVEITGLPTGAYFVDATGNTTGAPCEGTSSTHTCIDCADLYSISLSLPANYDVSWHNSRFTIYAEKPSIADPSIILKAEDVQDTVPFKIQPINDAPVVGVLVGTDFDSAPVFNVVNMWGYKTLLPRFKLHDVDLEGNDVFVHVSVDFGLLAFGSATTLRLRKPDTTGFTTDDFSEVTVPPRSLNSLDNTFSDVKFLCVPEVCANILNSLHYIAAKEFAGNDKVTIHVDDLGSTGACLPGHGPSLFSDCTSHRLVVPITVECESETPFLVWSGEENVYAKLAANDKFDTVYNKISDPSATNGNGGGGGGGGGGNGNGNGGGTTFEHKMLICHGTAAETNPYSFLGVSRASAFGHFLSGQCDDEQCCADELASLGYETGTAEWTAAYDDCKDKSGGHGQNSYRDAFLGKSTRSRVVLTSDDAVCPLNFRKVEVDGVSQCEAQVSCGCTFVGFSNAKRFLVSDSAGSPYVSSTSNFVAGEGTVMSETDKANLAAGAATEESATPEEDSALWSLVAAGAAVAVVGLLVAVVLIRRRSSGSKTETDVEGAAPGAAAPVAKAKKENKTWVQELSEVEPSNEGSIYALAAAIEADADESASLVSVQ